MRKVYIVSTRFIGKDYMGKDYFFNEQNELGTINLPNDNNKLYRCEEADVIIYGFDDDNHYPNSGDGFLNSLREEFINKRFINEDDNVFFILHAKNLCREGCNYRYRDNVVGFQHEDVDFFAHFLRTFKGSAKEFADRFDFLLKGLELYKNLGKKIEQCIYQLDNDPLIDSAREFSLTGSNYIELKNQLRDRMR